MHGGPGQACLPLDLVVLALLVRVAGTARVGGNPKGGGDLSGLRPETSGPTGQHQHLAAGVSATQPGKEDITGLVGLRPAAPAPHRASGGTGEHGGGTGVIHAARYPHLLELPGAGDGDGYLGAEQVSRLGQQDGPDPRPITALGGHHLGHGARREARGDRRFVEHKTPMLVKSQRVVYELSAPDGSRINLSDHVV